MFFTHFKNPCPPSSTIYSASTFFFSSSFSNNQHLHVRHLTTNVVLNKSRQHAKKTRVLISLRRRRRRRDAFARISETILPATAAAAAARLTVLTVVVVVRVTSSVCVCVRSSSIIHHPSSITHHPSSPIADHGGDVKREGLSRHPVIVSRSAQHKPPPRPVHVQPVQIDHVHLGKTRDQGAVTLFNTITRTRSRPFTPPFLCRRSPPFVTV